MNRHCLMWALNYISPSPGIGLNAKVQIKLGTSTDTIELPNKAPSIGSIAYQPPMAAAEIELKVLNVHSENNNGFQRVQVWTQGE